MRARDRNYLADKIYFQVRLSKVKARKSVTSTLSVSILEYYLYFMYTLDIPKTPKTILAFYVGYSPIGIKHL